jgi:hypothetical protein
MDNDLIKRYVDYEPVFGKTKRGTPPGRAKAPLVSELPI